MGPRQHLPGQPLQHHERQVPVHKGHGGGKHYCQCSSAQEGGDRAPGHGCPARNGRQPDCHDGRHQGGHQHGADDYGWRVGDQAQGCDAARQHHHEKEIKSGGGRGGDFLDDLLPFVRRCLAHNSAQWFEEIHDPVSMWSVRPAHPENQAIRSLALARFDQEFGFIHGPWRIVYNNDHSPMAVSQFCGRERSPLPSGDSIM